MLGCAEPCTQVFGASYTQVTFAQPVEPPYSVNLDYTDRLVVDPKDGTTTLVPSDEDGSVSFDCGGDGAALEEAGIDLLSCDSEGFKIGLLANQIEMELTRNNADTSSEVLTQRFELDYSEGKTNGEHYPTDYYFAEVVFPAP